MKPTHALLPLWEDRNPDQKIEMLYNMVQDLYYYVLQDTLKQLDSILASHVPYDEKEEKDVQFIRNWLQEKPNLINMNCEMGHLTGSALVIDVKGGRFLLHRHKTLRDKWLQFGGHADYERDFSLVALREAREESGLHDLQFFPDIDKPVPLDIDVHTIPSAKGRPEHFHLDLRYLLTTNTPDKVSPDDSESNDMRWVAFDQIEDIKNNIGYPLYRLIIKAKNLISVK